MDFACACVAQKFYNAHHRRTADNGIVYEDNSLTLNRFHNGVELDFNLILTNVLTGIDKRSADVFILNQTKPVRNPRFLRIPDCRVDTRIGCADNDVRFYG